MRKALFSVRERVIFENVPEYPWAREPEGLYFDSDKGLRCGNLKQPLPPAALLGPQDVPHWLRARHR